MLTAVQAHPITNGTWLYSLIITKENLEKADSYTKYTGLYAIFYTANMILQTVILYPFFHIYNYELCRRPTTPSGVPYISLPHMSVCYSLLLTTAAVDNFANFTLKEASQPFRESDFLMTGNSVSQWLKLKAKLWNSFLTLNIIVLSTAIAYPAEIKWRRYLVNADSQIRCEATVKQIWSHAFRGNIWTGFWASCLRNGVGSLLLN